MLTAQSQTFVQRLGRSVQLLPSDAAILEGQEFRTDLPCVVKPITPQLGFDLNFHGGYDVTVPLQELAGSGNLLTAVFRVFPLEQPDNPVYFSQKWSVPAVAEDARGKAELRGELMLGQGHYQFEWLLRDQAARVCASRWQIAVEPRGKEKQVSSLLAHGTVQPEPKDPFIDLAPVKHEEHQPLHVLIFLHLAPGSQSAIAMRRTEIQALLSILRCIAQEPRIGSYSIVAFDLNQNAVLYRRSDVPELDLSALGQLSKQVRPGTIGVQSLRQNDSGAGFLSKLVGEETIGRSPDAIIFAGSRTHIYEFHLSHSVKELGQPRCPVFYLDYVADPVLNPWRDAIGTLVKFWKGSQYDISTPSQLVPAWNDLMSRITTRKAPDALSTAPSDFAEKKF